MMRLSELKTGESATVVKVMGYGGFRRRIMEMGFVRGQRVDVLLDAPLKDPVEYRIMGYDVSLRRKEAEMIVVISDREAQRLLARKRSRRRYVYPAAERPDTFRFDSLRMVHPERCRRLSAVDEHDDAGSIEQLVTRTGKRFSVALVGNPNSGKTTLFNVLSGSHEHVGNYSGVTVDAKSGRLKYKGYTIDLTDLPGTYALSAYTPEEVYVRRFLIDHTPDVVVNTVVASNLERNLYLSTEMIDINPKMVIALNMYDELERSGARFDYDTLGRMIGVPMVPVVANSGRGIAELLDTIIAVYENEDDRVRHVHIDYGSVVEDNIEALNDDMRRHRDTLPAHFPPRYFALKMIEGDSEILSMLSSAPRFERWRRMAESAASTIERELGDDVETVLADRKYGFVSGALKETFVAGRPDDNGKTQSIDALVTHRVWGYPIFFLAMWFMFYCTFELGAYPQQWIESGKEWLYEAVRGALAEGALRDMLTDGVINGVGSVLAFLPNIVILYMFISFMEDSGYLARAAFIMDKVMHHVGVHGKSFIPLVMGFGCNVPAVMACRTIECRTSRLITIFIVPFMSCSARLPIYMMIVGTFFTAHAGTVLFLLYVAGMAVAVVTARAMRRFMFREQEAPFVMELSPYRIPSLRTTVKHMWSKCAQYLRKMGGLILVASIVVWFLSYYPRPEADTQSSQPDYESSYMGDIGRFCQPVFEPMGLNWKASVAILSGVPAKEIVVSTMNILYSAPDSDCVPAVPAESDSVQPTSSDRIAHSMSIPSAIAFLVFVLLYMPCIATVGAIGSEAGWRWAVVSVIYNTVVAWALAYAAYLLAGLII